VTEPAACLNCGKPFQPWPVQQYCSRRCRKRAGNERAGYVRPRFREGGAIPHTRRPVGGLHACQRRGQRQAFDGVQGERPLGLGRMHRLRRAHPRHLQPAQVQ
jgi:hypothetical protein